MQVISNSAVRSPVSKSIQAVAVWIVRRHFKRFGVAFRVGIPQNVHRVVMAPVRWEDLVEGGEGLVKRRELALAVGAAGEMGAGVEVRCRGRAVVEQRGKSFSGGGAVHGGEKLRVYPPKAD